VIAMSVVLRTVVVTGRAPKLHPQSRTQCQPIAERGPKTPSSRVACSGADQAARGAEPLCLGVRR